MAAAFGVSITKNRLSVFKKRSTTFWDEIRQFKLPVFLI